MRLKGAGIQASTYSTPANLAAFLVEFMFPPLPLRPTSCRWPPRRHRGAFDDQPEGEPHLEDQQGRPDEPGERSADDPDELQGKDDRGQDRSGHTDPRQ